MKVLSSLFTRLVQVLGGSLHNGCNPSQHCVVESSCGSVWRGECRELLSHLSHLRSAVRPGLLTCDHQHVNVVTQLLVTMGKKGRKNKPGKKKVEPGSFACSQTWCWSRSVLCLLYFFYRFCLYCWLTIVISVNVDGPD